MFTVYMHITPNNKRYIGISGSYDLNIRFGANGGNYRNQIFGRAIKKYGWDNIQHIIVAQDLSEEDAKRLEIELIAKYDTTNPKYGYNRSIGGDVPVILGQHHTEEAKKKIGVANSKKIRTSEQRKQISDSVKKLWLTEEYRTKQKNRIVSDETRHKMAESHRGKVYSAEHKQKIRLGNLGKHQGVETKQLLSKIVKEQHEKEKMLGIKRNYNNSSDKTAGTKWYNNGVSNIRRKDGCPDGYVEGRIRHTI